MPTFTFTPSGGVSVAGSPSLVASVWQYVPTTGYAVYLGSLWASSAQQYTPVTGLAIDAIAECCSDTSILVWVVSNTVALPSVWDATNAQALSLMLYLDYFVLTNYETGTSAISSHLSTGTRYYVKMTRLWTVVTAEIYSDPDKTVLVESITITDVPAARTYQYIFGLSNNSAEICSDPFFGDVSNYSLIDYEDITTDMDWSVSYTPTGHVLVDCAQDWDTMSWDGWATKDFAAWGTFLAIGCVSEHSLHLSYTPITGLVLGGDVLLQIGYPTEGSGGVVIGGEVGFVSDLVYTPECGVLIDCTMAWEEFDYEEWDRFKYCDWLLWKDLTCQADADWGTSYISGALLAINGSSEIDLGDNYKMSGGVIIGIGAASTYDWGTSYIATGALDISGSSDADWGAIHLTPASLVLNGASDSDWGASYVPISGWKINGEVDADWGTSYQGLEALVLNGDAGANSGASYIPDGELVFGTSTTYDWSATYIVVHLMIIGGAVQPDWSTAFNATGQIILGLDANVSIDWATHHVMVGGLIIGISADSDYDWGTSDIADGGLIIDVVAQYALALSYIPIGGVVLGGETDSQIGMVHISDGTIILSTLTDYDWGTSYVAGGLLNLSDSSQGDWGASFAGGDVLILGGESDADLGTTFLVFGSVIIGFNARTQAHWGTSYTSSGVLTLGDSFGADWGASHVAGGLIILGGDFDADIGAIHKVTGQIILGVSANTTVDWATHYIWSGGLIIGVVGAADVDWGTSYEIPAHLYIGGGAIYWWTGGRFESRDTSLYFGLHILIDNIQGTHVNHYRKTMQREPDRIQRHTVVGF